MRLIVALAPLALAGCVHASGPPSAGADPAYTVCGPDGAVDWDDNPSAPPPHCNRDGWDGTRYPEEKRT